MWACLLCKGLDGRCWVAASWHVSPLAVPRSQSLKKRRLLALFFWVEQVGRALR